MTDGRDKLDEILDDAWDRLEVGDGAGARKLHAEACQLDPKDRDVGLLEVELLAAEGLGEEAVVACEQLMSRHSEDPVVEFTLARLLLEVYDEVREAHPLLEQVKKRLDEGKTVDLREPDPDRAEEAQLLFRVDLLISLSDCRGADHDPVGAQLAAEEAVDLDREDARARLALAAAQFDLHQLDDAEKLVARAVDLEPRYADAWWQRGRILTHRGDEEGANKAFARARAIDPERFVGPVRMSEDAFTELMQKSLEELPPKVQSYLENVAIAVEDLPPVDRLAESQPPLSPGLLGLYEGTPPSLAEGEDPWAHHPRHITLFRKNLEIAAQTEDDLKDLIATTLWHEIGHYLGLDEEDLEERGLG